MCAYMISIPCFGGAWIHRIHTWSACDQYLTVKRIEDGLKCMKLYEIDICIHIYTGMDVYLYK